VLENLQNKILELYEEVHRCKECLGADGCKISEDRSKVRRKLIEESLKSDLFLVGQALAEKTQRLSGIPYHYETLEPSSTGKALNDFLALFGYTIYPKGNDKYPYSSDIIQCWPGSNGEGDRKPTKTEVKNCLPWLKKEIELLKPKLVILLGGLSREVFLGKSKEWAEPIESNDFGSPITFIAIPHPSYRRRKPHEVDVIYKKAAELSKKILCL